jgi:hypothetical protein
MTKKMPFSPQRQRFSVILNQRLDFGGIFMPARKRRL